MLTILTILRVACTRHIYISPTPGETSGIEESSREFNKEQFREFIRQMCRGRDRNPHASASAAEPSRTAYRRMAAHSFGASPQSGDHVPSFPPRSSLVSDISLSLYERLKSVHAAAVERGVVDRKATVALLASIGIQLPDNIKTEVRPQRDPNPAGSEPMRLLPKCAHTSSRRPLGFVRLRRAVSCGTRSHRVLVECVQFGTHLTL